MNPPMYTVQGKYGVEEEVDFLEKTIAARTFVHLH